MLASFLSKSDFKLGRDCPAKLYYKKHYYPSDMEGDEYLELLADGGYMIGKMAQVIYPEGIEIKADSSESAAHETEKYLNENENITLFEACIYSENKLIRIDILKKEKNILKLIEVKSKSFNSKEYEMEGNNYFLTKVWVDYLEDVAYQKLVLLEKYPQYKIESFLLMPDKSKKTDIDGLISWFEIRSIKKRGNFRVPDIIFTGDKEKF